MVQYCAVPHCKNRSGTSHISFHSLPLNPDLRKQWLIKIRRDERKCKTSCHMRVCSAHFLRTDYRTVLSGRQFLKQNSVPSVFAFTSPRKVKPPRRKLTYKLGLQVYNAKDAIGNDVPSTSQETISFLQPNIVEHRNIDNNNIASQDEVENISLIPVGSTCEEQVLMKRIQDNEFKISQLEKEKILLSAQLDATSHALQVAKREKQVLQHSLLMNRHKKNRLQSECTVLKSHKLTMVVIKTNKVWIQYYTAFENLEALNAFMLFVIPDHSVHPISSKNINTSKLSVADELLLVLVKLRQGFENTDLAFRFNIHTKLVAKIFKEWINYLYSRLGALNIWPHRDIILNHAPDRFQKNFPLTIIILDGTEFKIEKPSSLVCQSQTYSNYKSSNTLKGLVGVDPRGGIIFISQLYSGAISDKEITKQSGFYEVLKIKLNKGEILPGDNVMADKGFNIQKEIEDCGLTLNIPPFARSQQFTEEEVLLTRKIASCRVNVERAIRRIKSFKLLKKQIPLTLLPLINQVWTVCCVLSNFRCSTR